MKNIFISIACLMSMVSGIVAIEYDMDDFMTTSSSVKAGYVNIDSDSFFKLGLDPQFSLGSLEVGLGVNLYIPLGDYSIPDSLDWVMLRHLAYDYNNTAGFRFGRLKRVTLGQGLLVDNFDSGSAGNSEFNQSKTGVLGYITMFDAKFTAMHTLENVQAFRIERPVIHLGAAPIIIGATYAQDTDGLDDDSTGRAITRPEQSGYAADISYPIGGQFLTLYSEFAELEDQGDGISAGFRGSILNFVDYKAEYRQLSKGFVPGYFNSTYQSTPFQFATKDNDDTDALVDDTTGFLVSASASILRQYVKVGVQYEKYEDIDVLTGALGWKQIGPVTGVINVSKPFNTEDNRAVAIANLHYKTGKLYDVLFRVKRIYESTNSYEESISIAVSFDANQLIPGLPF